MIEYYVAIHENAIQNQKLKWSFFAEPKKHQPQEVNILSKYRKTMEIYITAIPFLCRANHHYYDREKSLSNKIECKFKVK